MEFIKMTSLKRNLENNKTNGKTNPKIIFDTHEGVELLLDVEFAEGRLTAEDGEGT